jgi:hypothetical protein
MGKFLSMPEALRPLKVFLCHASADKPRVHELYRRLAAEGWIDPWLDAAKLLPGQHWSMVIKEALAEADSVIIFISNHSINREGFSQRELNLAWDLSLEKPRRAIYLIPLRLEACDVPYELRERQWADYFGEKQEDTYQALLKSLKLRCAQKISIEVDEIARNSEEKIVHEQITYKPTEKSVKSGVEHGFPDLLRSLAKYLRSLPSVSKASVRIIIIMAIISLAGVLCGTVWLNPFYRNLLLAQFAPVQNTPALSVSTPRPTNTLAPVVSSAPSATGSPSTFPAVPISTFSSTNNLSETIVPVPLVTETVNPSAEPTVSKGTPHGGGAGEIAFAAVIDNVAQIFMSNSDGTNLHQLTHDLNGACSFDWSPDGKQIVFVSPCTERTSQYPNSALYVLDVETGAISMLFSTPAGDFEPAWSPDGTKIAFTSMRDGSMQIYILDKSSSNISRLTSPDNNIQSRYPAWSPDGTKIAYTVRRIGMLQIWSMDADGNNKQQLTQPGGASISDYLPAWSPDGKYLLFSETNADLTAPSSLMQLILGDKVAKLVPVQPPVVDADFSPDGQWIAYETSDTKNQDIFIYHLLSVSPPQRLTTAGKIYFDPVWRPVK